MLSPFSLLTSGIAAVIAIIAWMTGAFGAVKNWHRRVVEKHRPPPPLDPDGDDADWGI